VRLAPPPADGQRANRHYYDGGRLRSRQAKVSVSYLDYAPSDPIGSERLPSGCTVYGRATISP